MIIIHYYSFVSLVTAALCDHRPVIARVDRQVELDLLERGVVDPEGEGRRDGRVRQAERLGGLEQPRDTPEQFQFR